MKQILIMLCLVVLTAVPVAAQDATPEAAAEPAAVEAPPPAENFDFPSGVSFSYPANWALFTDSDLTAMLVDDTQRGYATVYDLTGSPVAGSLEELMQVYGEATALQWAGEFSLENIGYGAVNGQEMAIYTLTGEQGGEPTTVYIAGVQVPSGAFTVITAYTVGDQPDFLPSLYTLTWSLVQEEVNVDSTAVDPQFAADIEEIDTIAKGAEPAPTELEELATAMEMDVSGIALDNSFKMQTGPEFSYPASYEIVSDEPAFVVTGEMATFTFVQFWDLAEMLGTSFDLNFYLETYGSAAADAWDAKGFTVDQFETISINDRNFSVFSFEGTQTERPAWVYVVIVPFDDGTYGLVQAYSLDFEPDNYGETVLAIAASFDK